MSHVGMMEDAMKTGCGALIISDRCNNSGAHPWVNQIQGKDPRILLLQRGLMAPTYPGYWGGPGGIQGAGESLEEVAARETLEESSIVFEPTSLFYQGELPDRKVFYFLGRWYAPERIVIQQDEAIGFGWFTFQEALRLSLSLRYREAITQLAMQFS